MSSRKADWGIPAGLIALSMVPAVAGTVRLAQLAGGASTPDNARFFDSPLPVLMHIPAAIVFSILGAFQFSRRRPWHRAAGKLLVPSGLLVALTGLWMAHFYAWPAGDGQAVYLERLIAGSAMLASILLGVRAIVRREFASHGAWMTRAYAIGMGAGTQMMTHLPWIVLVDGRPGEFPRAVMMGAGWAINVLVAELAIRSTSRAPAPVNSTLRAVRA